MNMNTTTAITLNDRFSMIKKQPSNTSIPEQRGRSRSRSRNRNQQEDLRGSRRNRMLLTQLERQHKMKMALKLKNKSLVASRGRTQAVNSRLRLKRAANIRQLVNPRKLRRSNSLTKFVPLNDTPSRLRQGRSRSRSRNRSRSRSRNRNQMQQNHVPVHERLGNIKPRRRMLRRNQQNGNGMPQRGRSRSRTRLNRNNFRNNTPVRRSNSVNARLGNNGPVQVQQQQNRRRRFRSRSRNNQQIRNNNRVANNGNRNINRNKNQINRPMTGRIVKKRINRNGTNIQQRFKNTAVKNIKKLQRGKNNNLNGQARGRARNRGQKNNQGGQQQRRGRSRTRRANRGKPQVSKDQLDKQLDEYMAKGSA